MTVIDKLLNEKGFSIVINQDMVIRGMSITRFDGYKGNTLGYKMFDLFNQTFPYGKNMYASLKKLLKDTFEHPKYVNQMVYVPKDDHNREYYAFNFSLDVFVMNGEKIGILNVTDFKIINHRYMMFQPMFNKAESLFPVFQNFNQLSRIVIDHSSKDIKVIVDDRFQELFQLEEQDVFEYYFVHEETFTHPNQSIILHDEFFDKLDLYMNQEISQMIDDIKIQNRWIRIEIVPYLKDENSNVPIQSIGVAYDITHMLRYTEAKYIQSLYDLAIQSGHIGVFYYDIEKHTNKYFYANEIYADMFGLDPHKNELYSTDDFMSSILEIEAELTENNVFEALDDLFEGHIEGTDDDLLKIKHLKTGEIKYLLSSSKIDSRFLNGKPKALGGIVIDITDRIHREKIEREKTYIDSLTGLGNNRRLYKDLEDAVSGVGIFIDLDNFKRINDTYGHKVGDEILIKLADILRQISIKEMKVYRLYGDEFFVYAEGKDKIWADEFIQKMNQATDLYNQQSKLDLEVDSSKGVYEFKKGDDVDDFIKQCDYEMYREKIEKHHLNKKNI